MTFVDELYSLEEKYNTLPERLMRDQLIKFLKDKIRILKGTDLQLAHENLARLYLNQGRDIKEEFMNAQEARAYFIDVLNSSASQTLRDAATYHLGHAALLERDSKAALHWFERALSSSVIDKGRKIKAHYHAARITFQMGEYDKAKEYLSSGRVFDTTRKYQTEYEATYYVIHTPQSGREFKPYLLSKIGEDPNPLSNAELEELMDGDGYAILDNRSPLHPQLYFQGRGVDLPEWCASMLMTLSSKEVHSDDYWLMNLFENLQHQSLKMTVNRQNIRLQVKEIPIKIARVNGKYVWEGPPLYVLSTIE
ncbi:hypothetical protein [Paenibacillus sp. LHD-38]|uniref:tetratricopeptide repeat protein n=1 Tax=Paenibacillus sp. LHD-38 TaxID=3072143 RepID=UPI00280F20BF|nr:hypothetical protein [Paenibacillus sp. LHD-38]MDQ8733982.1 hypothetical protein [Paenibacillus sp. LHD-38]